jgi:serine/threonine protein kinase
MFGQVKLVTHKQTKARFAMKHIDLQKIRGNATINLYLSMREIELMKKLDHPHVIKLYEIFRDTSNLYMIMECCTVLFPL